MLDAEGWIRESVCVREEERRARRRKELGVEITLDNCADKIRWLLGQVRAEE